MSGSQNVQGPQFSWAESNICERGTFFHDFMFFTRQVQTIFQIKIKPRYDMHRSVMLAET